jgi:YidC/Oxa1 family membrane protein insertase
MSSLLSAPMGVAYNFVVVLAHVFAPLGGGPATVAAIVVFTLAVRLLLSPLTFFALRGQASIAALQPRVQELQKRYAKQPDRLQAELTALYRAEGGGLLAGCLPLLLQLPFFSIMYRLFLSGSIDGKHNSLLSHELLGAPLGSHWLTGAGPFSAHGLVFLALFALLALAGLVSARLARSSSPTPPPAGGVMAGLTRVLPFTTVVIAAFVPLAAGLYLLTSTSWTIAERAILRRRVTPARRVAAEAAVLPAGSRR